MQAPIWPQVLFQALFITSMAVSSAAETAVSGLNESALRRQGEGGDRKAAALLALLGRVERVHTALRTAVVLSSSLSTACAAAVWAGPLARWAETALGLPPGMVLDGAAVAVTALAAALLLLVLGELAPRRIGLVRPEETARALCGLIRAETALLRPLGWVLDQCGKPVLRLFRIDPSERRDRASEENIRMMMDLGEERGTIDAAEKKLIDNVFDFNDLTAEDVMIHRTEIVSIWVEDTEDEIARTIEESGLSRFPVYDEDLDDVIGILFSRDYFLNARRDRPLPLRKLLRKTYFVPESVPAGKLFRDMQSRKMHLAVVVDEYGGTSGLLTMEDLLEEIVGKIYDEFDPQDEQEIIRLGEDKWRVAGSADLDDLAEALEMEFPEDEEAETLGGLVFAQLSVIPEDGSRPVVDADGLHIQVEELSDHRVEWAIVTKLPPERLEDDD
ncbi:hemolysin family protein [Pseudoflavonifractor sp. MSJ-37]|uniref:hemolysin family protein n=1 Tax=Pseudoflavonifractor sp. MSJ-37 TaxID=2841531 RepID=UPI0035301648